MTVLLLRRSVQDEDDRPGIAAPRRVSIDGVADADAEATDAGVPNLDTLARGDGGSDLRKRSVIIFLLLSVIGRSSGYRGLPVGYRWATRPRRSPANW